MLKDLVRTSLAISGYQMRWVRRATAHFGLNAHKSVAFCLKDSSNLSGHIRHHDAEVGTNCSHLCPDTQNEAPVAHSGGIWGQAAQMLKMKPLKHILAISHISDVREKITDITPGSLGHFGILTDQAL